MDKQGSEKMLKSYKTELKPTEEQSKKIRQTIGTCRFIYNFYLGHNKELYATEHRFVLGMEFSVWLNNSFLPNNPEYRWIKNVSSKAVKQSIMNAEKAFKRFFKGQSKFPQFKKKSRQNIKAYFPKNNKGDWTCERHRLKIPTLGFVRLKEKGYIPTKADIRSGTVSVQAGRYFVSVLVDEPEVRPSNTEYTDGIGLDLGLKSFVVSSGRAKPFPSISKSKRVKKAERKLRREQKRLSRKYEKRKRGEKSATYSANINKQVKKVQALHLRLTNVKTDYLNKVVAELVKTKPAFIAIEDLNVRGMMQNRHLARAVAGQKFYEFRTKLTAKAKQRGIEVRVVDRFYPSSKLCSCCGVIKPDLKLSDRVYTCSSCGTELDRDFNASQNLANAKTYKLAS